MRKAGSIASQLGNVLLLWLATALLLLSGCDESVEPFLDTDRQMTLFGTLDMARDTQFIRVVPIREQLRAPKPGAPLDVNFTSTNPATGQTVTWSDSVVAFDNGTFGHVFYAPLRVRPGHTYRIEATPAGSDLATIAQTTLPDAITPFVQPEDVDAGGLITNATQQIFWEDLRDDSHHIDLWYRFLGGEGSSFIDLQLPYEPTHEQFGRCPMAGCSGPGRKVTLNLVQDRDSLREMISIGSAALVGLGLRVTLLDDNFVPPGGAFDEEVQRQPGTFSNVTNGFGFVGSVGRFDVEWTLRDESIRILGYQTFEDVFGKKIPPELQLSLPHGSP